MTTAQIQARLDAYLAAEAAILSGNQSTTIEGMVFEKADLKAIQNEIRNLRVDLAASEGTAFASGQVVFGGGR